MNVAYVATLLSLFVLAVCAVFVGAMLLVELRATRKERNT